MNRNWVFWRSISTFCVSLIFLFAGSGCSEDPTTPQGGGEGGQDTNPPGPVTDFHLSGINQSSLTVTWTAVGDDGQEGSADHYEIRYSTSPLNSENFGQATEVSLVPDPGNPPTKETCEISDLAQGTTYHVGLIVFDEKGNHSELTTVEATTADEPGQRMVLEKLWSLDYADEDLLVGYPIQIAVNNLGQVGILDVQLSQLLLLSPEGELISIIGREGDGPGEFRNPVGMVQFNSGEYGVVKSPGSEIVKLHSDGSPAGACYCDSDPHNPPLTWAVSVIGGDDCLVVKGIDQVGSGGTLQYTPFVRSFFQDCALNVDFWSAPAIVIDPDQTLREADLFPQGCPFGIMPNGYLAISDIRDAYQVSIISDSGQPFHSLQRPYESWQRDARAMELAEWRYFSSPIPIEIDMYEPDVSDVQCPADGTIWVQTSRGRWEPPTGAYSVYDVFDASGNFEREAVIVCNGDAAYDRLIFSGDYVFHVSRYWAAGFGHEDTWGESILTCFRMPD